MRRVVRPKDGIGRLSKDSGVLVFILKMFRGATSGIYCCLREMSLLGNRPFLA